MQTLFKALRFLLKLPYFWMPKKWKGYRTIIITMIVSILSLLQGLDWLSLEAVINQIGQLVNPNFLIDLPEEEILTYIGLSLAELRTETNTEFGCTGEECENMIGV